MSETNIEGSKDVDVVDNTPKVQVDNDPSLEDPKHSDTKEENPMPSPEQEEEVIKKKYGGLLPKKTPLISKDHERAFFDSADWALGKQGAQKSKGPLEALRPKLQAYVENEEPMNIISYCTEQNIAPTPHNQVRSRRSAYAPAGEGEDGGNPNTTASEDEIDSGNIDNANSEDQNCHK